ncbi:MAG: sialidase family protein [Actinomycetota bacterium]
MRESLPIAPILKDSRRIGANLPRNAKPEGVMQTRRLIRGAVASIIVLSTVATAHAATNIIVGSDPATRVTLFFHSVAPVTTAEDAGPSAGASTEPAMDQTPPALAPAKVAPLGPGNPSYRKNPFLAYWSAPVNGHITNASADVFLGVAPQGTLEATLFGDGGVGVGGVIGSAHVTVTTPGLVHFVFQNVNAEVTKEIVFSVDATDAGSVLYDSTLTPSAVSFDLGAYAPPPPIVPPSPSAGWNPEVVASTDRAQRETSLAIDPTNSDRMMMCDPSGVPDTTDGHSWFFDTIDAGAHWNYLQNTTNPNDTRSLTYAGGDCDVAYDSAGTMYTADTWLGDLSIGSSRDGGKNWFGTTLAGSTPIVDRPWIVGGAAGTVYATYQDVQAAMPSAIWFTHSSDYGATFAPATLVASAGPDGAWTWEGNFAAAPNGMDFYTVYTRRQLPTSTSGSLDDNGPETVWVAASHDGGSTWTSHLVASMPNPASYLYPSIALDHGGMLHVVFSSKTSTDRPIWYTVSSDGALTWTPPVKLMSGAAGFSPWVDATTPGTAVVQWYGSPDPNVSTSTASDWYLYWARITNSGTSSMTIATGTTTTSALFHGKQGSAGTPEFNMVRLAPDGTMRIGASVMRADSSGSQNWAIYYQSETSGV